MDCDKQNHEDVLLNVSADVIKTGEHLESYLTQYRIYLEHLDKIADRRQSSNSFFLTINSGLCAILAFLGSKDATDDIRSLLVVIPFAGIVLSCFWYRLVASYRQLSTGKFDIVHRMEKHLPMAPYRAEWEVLGQGKDSSKYMPLTHIEVWVPRLFVVMYVGLLLYMVPWISLVHFIDRVD